MPNPAHELAAESFKSLITLKLLHGMNVKIILHRWESFPRSDGVVTRSSPVARRTAFLKLSRMNNTTSVTGESSMNGTTTTTTQLDLPFDKIVDRPPRHPLEGDFVITEQELRRFAERIWREQGLL
ncbi:hypothetical protein BDV25DRAFT_135691 [Aspergillus avenaceus]|uniref:Uncharacterized protein n=1 Tax=Aspergillus avenaceus TaxID=36643 RepID=A0A5N6U7J6_ASPAV|nr:hypothetical protein BDV25DRAFT_135691 [Aspergillus avenaceus]